MGQAIIYDSTVFKINLDEAQFCSIKNSLKFDYEAYLIYLIYLI